ncbi:MAG: ArsA-related P-loop ATPase [Ethanoligenens sp.]
MSNITLVCGGSGVGKTTFAAALAARLAHDKVHTLLISPDSYIPAFGLWVHAPAKKPVSLGGILERELTAESVAAGAYLPQGNRHSLGLLSYLPGEVSDKYTPPGMEQAERLLQIASTLAHQVVVDGTGYGDALTRAAAKLAGIRFALVEPGPRGLLLQKSRPPEKGVGETLWIVCPRAADDPVEETEKRLHVSFFSTLPQSVETHAKLTESRLFAPYADKAYRQAVEKAANAITGGAA